MKPFKDLNVGDLVYYIKEDDIVSEPITEIIKHNNRCYIEIESKKFTVPQNQDVDFPFATSKEALIEALGEDIDKKINFIRFKINYAFQTLEKMLECKATFNKKYGKTI